MNKFCHIGVAIFVLSYVIINSLHTYGRQISFLDELPEFNKNVLNVLRQPMEERVITISRTKQTADYPASFMLVAAMNPCPCGYYNHPTIPCTCAPGAVNRYMGKVSGPLLDRIEIQKYFKRA